MLKIHPSAFKQSPCLRTGTQLSQNRILHRVRVQEDVCIYTHTHIMEYLPLNLDEAMQRMTVQQAVSALSEAAIGI
jgi:hypothetical protein